MCNISGFVGDQSPNLYKIKLLAAMGTERGEDSMGIVFDNTCTKKIKPINYSVRNEALGYIFIQDLQLYEPAHNHCVMIHNRKKSYGGSCKDSAHPYEIEYQDEEGNNHSFFFMHNGTLTNVPQLAKHYKLKESDYKTDSELLANIIFEFGYEVFEYYEGDAACAWFWTTEPNTLYLFKGGKEINKWTPNTQQYTKSLQEERPLSYVIHNEGIYFSSLDSQLNAISSNEKIYDLEMNKVIKVKNKELEIIKNIERNEKKVESISKVKETKPYLGYLNKISYYDSHYYLNNELCHGPINVSLDGIVDGAGAETLYFCDGFWLKDEKTYNEYINDKERKYLIQDFHEDAVCCSTKNKYHKGSNIISYEIFRPKFGIFFLKLGNKGKLLNDYTLYQVMKDGLISVKQAAIEKFNEDHDTKLNNIKDCKRYYEILHSSELDWENLYENKYPNTTSINIKYKNNRANNNAYFRNNKTYNKDENLLEKYREEIDDFNKRFETEFNSRIKANSWYKARYGLAWNEEWPVDEEFINSYKTPENNEEKFNQLLFNFEENYDEELMLAEKQFQKDFKVLKKASDSIYNAYFGIDLGKDIKEKLDVLNKLKNI